jgi:Flp pilus assembly protein TadB
MNGGGNTISEPLEEARERSLEDDVRDVVGQARDYARTEFAFQKTRAAYAGKSAGWIALWVGAALVFVFFALMALVFGAILALAPLITALGATAAVTGVLLVLAALSGVSALHRWRKVTELFSDEDAP